jgi:cellulose synthase/poly-beta-1,6-N-acetylglucosamine synthase-like glycosyltransferase
LSATNHDPIAAVTTVAVVVPVRNGRHEIGECVDRLRAQTRPPDEIVVVDNGSSDGSGEEAARHGATVVVEPIAGVYRARNLGWRATSSDVVAFTDADCEPEPDWLAQLLVGLADPQVAGVGGEIVAVEVSSPAQRWAYERGFLSQASHVEHPFMAFFANANVAYRRSALETVGGFEERLVSGGDTDLAWRVQAFAHGRLVFRPEARVAHHFGESWRELTSQHRRYARGHVALAARWARWPSHVASQGKLLARTRAVWLLPARLPWRIVTGKPLSVPLIDAATRVAYEMGRRQGRRELPALGLEALPGP